MYIRKLTKILDFLIRVEYVCVCVFYVIEWERERGYISSAYGLIFLLNMCS